MKITEQCVVALTWTLKDTLGEELDVLDDPVEFLVGGSDLLGKIEEGLQGHQAAGRQLRAPGRKLVSGQRLGNHHARIHRMHLDNPLGQIHPDSGNLVYGLPLSHGCRLMTRTVNLGASTPLPEGGKSLLIPTGTSLSVNAVN